MNELPPSHKPEDPEPKQAAANEKTPSTQPPVIPVLPPESAGNQNQKTAQERTECRDNHVGIAVGLGFGGQVPQGIWIEAQNRTNQPPYGGAIQDALRAIGIETRGYENPRQKEPLVIWVGSKHFEDVK
jgi:hypothetical protein